MVSSGEIWKNLKQGEMCMWFSPRHGEKWYWAVSTDQTIVFSDKKGEEVSEGLNARKKFKEGVKELREHPERVTYGVCEWEETPFSDLESYPDSADNHLELED